MIPLSYIPMLGDTDVGDIISFVIVLAVMGLSVLAKVLEKRLQKRNEQKLEQQRQRRMAEGRQQLPPRPQPQQPPPVTLQPPRPQAPPQRHQQIPTQPTPQAQQRQRRQQELLAARLEAQRAMQHGETIFKPVPASPQPQATPQPVTPAAAKKAKQRAAVNVEQEIVRLQQRLAALENLQQKRLGHYKPKRPNIRAVAETAVTGLPEGIVVDLRDPTAARSAVVLREILSPPKALRSGDEMWDM